MNLDRGKQSVRIRRKRDKTDCSQNLKGGKARECESAINNSVRNWRAPESKTKRKTPKKTTEKTGRLKRTKKGDLGKTCHNFSPLKKRYGVAPMEGAPGTSAEHCRGVTSRGNPEDNRENLLLHGRQGIGNSSREDRKKVVTGVTPQKSGNSKSGPWLPSVETEKKTPVNWCVSKLQRLARGGRRARGGEGGQEGKKGVG